MKSVFPFFLAAVFLLPTGASADAVTNAASNPRAAQLISKEMIRTHGKNGPVTNGFVTYIRAGSRVLLLCTGRENYSDASDDFTYEQSNDNGKTWSKPRLAFKSEATAEGKFRWGEMGAYFDENTGKLTLILNQIFHPGDAYSTTAKTVLYHQTYDSKTDRWSTLEPLKGEGIDGVTLSFCFPFKSSTGRLVFPAMRPLLDKEGKHIYHRGSWSPAYEAVTLLGDPGPGGILRWHAGKPVQIDLEKSCRGLEENAIAELQDGRFAMVSRGDNSMFPERPGYKWVSFSEDKGESWAEPQPMAPTEGELIESSASGSALFRSEKNGKLYWMGNLCLDGQRPNGNLPRTKLVIAEMQEKPFAIKRESITVIDERKSDEPGNVQLSNFRFYQDRENGDIIVFLSRLSEEDAIKWYLANYYRFRVKLNN